MAFIFDQTECVACGERVASRPWRILRLAEANRRGQLWPLNDAPIHEHCLDRHPLRDAILTRLAALDDRDAFACLVCGDRVDHPDDVWSACWFSDDPSHPMHRFDGVVIHRWYGARWTDLAAFESGGRELEASEEWGAWRTHDLPIDSPSPSPGDAAPR